MVGIISITRAVVCTLPLKEKVKFLCPGIASPSIFTYQAAFNLTKAVLPPTAGELITKLVPKAGFIVIGLFAFQNMFGQPPAPVGFPILITLGSTGL